MSDTKHIKKIISDYASAGWKDTAEQAAAELVALQTEVERLKGHYFQLADAIASESESCEQLCDIARKTRYERNALQEEVERLKTALDDLQKWEAAYRLSHDLNGVDSQEAGWHWDKLRQSGDRARKALEPE